MDNTKNNIEQNINEDNFIFANLILGVKGIPLYTETLLVNNIVDNSLDIIYAVENNKQAIKIPVNNVKSISCQTSTRIQNITKKTESNETKSMLLSAVVFGGHPLLQLAGNSAFNNFFDGVSSNYDKINLNTHYEITIEVIIDNQDSKFILNTSSNPEIFINQINEMISLNNI